MDWHYHANHIDAPARGSKAAAMKDAKALHLSLMPDDGWLVAPVSSVDTVREHGVEFPLIVKCFRECVIQRNGSAS